MGYYVNPDLATKEEWLMEHGLLVTGPKWEHLSNFPGGIFVCLVDNGPFTAAAICYCEQEFNEFNSTLDDPRPRQWFVVPRVDIVQVCPQVEGVL